MGGTDVLFFLFLPCAAVGVMGADSEIAESGAPIERGLILS